MGSAFGSFGDAQEFCFLEVGCEDLEADGEVLCAIEIRGVAGDGNAGDADYDRGKSERFGPGQNRPVLRKSAHNH